MKLRALKVGDTVTVASLSGFNGRTGRVAKVTDRELLSIRVEFDDSKVVAFRVDELSRSAIDELGDLVR